MFIISRFIISDPECTAKLNCVDDKRIKNIKLQPVPPSNPRSHYQFCIWISIVPPMAFTETQVVIIYILHIDIVSYNRAVSKILV